MARYYNNELITITDDDDKEIDDPVRYLQKKGFLAYVITEEVKTDIVLELSNQEKDYLNKHLELPDSFLYKSSAFFLEIKPGDAEGICFISFISLESFKSVQ